MQIIGFGSSQPGLIRKIHDNVILVENDSLLYGVCDGAGGTAAGEVAAKIAMDSARVMFLKRRGENGATDASTKAAILNLKGAIRYANAAVYRKSVEDSSLRGMGASMTLATIVDNRLVVGHVGNTRLFLLRGSALTQITQDHTVGQDPTVNFAEDGEIKRGALTRALGVCQDIVVDTYQFELLPGDRLLLCSEGLRGIVESTTPYLKALTTTSSPELIPERLLYIAMGNGGGKDSVSAILVNVEADPERLEAEMQRKDEAMLRIDSVRQVFLFRDLELDELLEVADRAVLLITRPDEVIFNEGEAGDAMYLIVDGRCAVMKNSEKVTELGEASHFGEMSLLSNAPRSGTVVSRERSKLLRISSEDFQEIIRSRPATGVKLLLALGKELSRRLAMANDR